MKEGTVISLLPKRLVAGYRYFGFGQQAIDLLLLEALKQLK
jgi:hypothetical protein